MATKKTGKTGKTPAKKSPKKTSRVRQTPWINTRSGRVVVGASIVVILLLITAACISYIFTGTGDQNVQTGESYGNVFGIVGYYVSHLLMNRLGVSVFCLLAVGYAVAAIVMLDKPFSRITLFISKMLMWAVWIGVVMAYFSSFYSGAWGYRLHVMLYQLLGWGLAPLLALLPLAWIILRFGITPEKLNQWREERSEAAALRAAEREARRAREKEEKELEKKAREAEKLALEKIAEAQDKKGVIYTVSGVDDDVLTEDEVDAIIKEDELQEKAYEEEYGCEEEDYYDVKDSYGKEDEEDVATPDVMENEGENLKGGTVIHEEGEDGIDFTLTVAGDESCLSEDVARRLVEEQGEYDPTLDLSTYRFPQLSMLRRFENESINVEKEEVLANRRRIVDTLKNYGIEISHIHSTVGPTVTLYEIIPAPGVKISKIKSLEDDIALSLSALGIRIIAPMPGKGTIGIEVPNKEPSIVSMNSVISSRNFQTSQMELPVAIGKNISNETVVFDLAKMPHLLMAGATGQGKSVGLNAVLTSLLYKKHPSQVKFVLVDPKKVELTLYNKIERHYLAKLPDSREAIITDTSKVIDTLNSLCAEMDARYDLLKEAYVRNIKEYNAKFISRRLNPAKGHKYMPYIVLVVDEFADLIMTAGKEVETPIARLAQLARAVGIHLIIATQRPSVNVITGSIKNNFTARIAFRVVSKIDSRTILDASGADQLIGKGDMLLSMSGSEIMRVQCAFVDTPEVEAICDFIGAQKGYHSAFLLPEVEHLSGEDGEIISIDERDPKFEEAARVVVAMQQGSASVIQRKLSIGFNRAGRIVDQLESAGIIGPFNGSKAREVLVQDETTLNRILYGTEK